MKPSTFAITRNAILLLPRLLATGLLVLFDQLFFTTSSRLKKFTSKPWLAEHLGMPPDQIESARIEEVHHGTASRSRLHIAYTDNPKAQPGPTSFFIKSRPPDYASALFGALFRLGGNEVSFYRQIRPTLPIPAPRVHYCEGDSKNYAMLLEDLAVKGSDFRELSSGCSLAQARIIVSTLARLHAHFWQSPRFQTDLSFVNRLETDRDFRLLDLVRQLAVPIALKKYAHVLPAEIREVVPHLMRNYGRLEQQWAKEPRTLLHGDAHLGNMYFQGDQVGFLDWQVTQLGQGMRDITYFLINSISTELRREHQEDLIRHYLSSLGDLGVTLDFDTAWRQYRLQSVYAWIAGVVTAPSNFQGEEVVVAGLTRSCKAILDLDAIELIREL